MQPTPQLTWEKDLGGVTATSSLNSEKDYDAKVDACGPLR